MEGEGRAGAQVEAVGHLSAEVANTADDVFRRNHNGSRVRCLANVRPCDSS